METQSSHIYPIDEALQNKNWSLEAAFQYCERLARKHYENFPVGSLLIPKKLRSHVCSIYAYARRADDIADEDFEDNQRIPALDAWLDLLYRSQKVRINHPVFLALQETIRQFQIPVQLLVDLVTAFKMDVQIKRYPTFEKVLYYCRHSANPVGRLVLHLFGYRDQKLMLLSDHICTALQLANFWQDISVDLQKNRIYIPLEDFEGFGYSEEQYFNSTYNEVFRRLLEFQVDRTEKIFQAGAPLIYQTKGRLRLELKCVVLGGMTILKKIRQIQYQTFEKRPVITKKDQAKILITALFAFKRGVGLSRAQVQSSLSQEEKAPV